MSSNKLSRTKSIEEKNPDVRTRNHQALRATAADPVAHRAFLLRASLIEPHANVRQRPPEAMYWNGALMFLKNAP
jgi:3-(3-hydroxy-phenyl)propionate hydroxylase